MRASPERFTRDAASKELQRIADWWLAKAPDTRCGGFVGEISHSGVRVDDANKGVVLNSRILWFFSAMTLFRNETKYRIAADRAFHYLLDYFDDGKNGGAVWELSCDGRVIAGKKQIYAQCFCIYAFCTYFRVAANPLALTKALEYVDAIETHARDRELGGYVDALSQDWQPTNDFRLGAADMNAPKTMNTHLHLLEAYSALHAVAPSRASDVALRRAITLICESIVNPETGHLRVFLDHDWNSLSAVVSYGHDIEASWLLWDAGETLGDADVQSHLRPIVERLAWICLQEGLGRNGQVCAEFDAATKHRSDESIWWVQAEALVGFLSAYRLTGEQRFRTAADSVWQFIHRYHIDAHGGDWHWLATLDADPDNPHYKAGFWKGPYHNGRAMLESIRLFDTLDET